MISGGGCQAQVSFDECHFKETAEVQGGFFESCKDASRLFEPTDQALDDVALPICFAVELYGTLAAVFIILGGDDRFDSQSEHIFVDPIGAVSLVAAELHGPSDAIAFTVEQLCVGGFQHRVEGGGFVGLPRRQMKMQRMTLAIAKDMDFCRKPPARAA